MKNKVIEYVMNSPGNTNRAVLESMLNGVIGGGGNDGDVTVQTIFDADLTEIDGMMIYEAIDNDAVKLVNGEEYTVKTGEDIFTAKATVGYDGGHVGWLGNLALMGDGNDDTGEPYVFYQEEGGGELGICAIATNGATHMTITRKVSSGSSSGGAKVFRLGLTLAETENMESFDIEGQSFVKISDQIPTAEEFANATLFTPKTYSSTEEYYVERKLNYYDEDVPVLAVDESDDMFSGLLIALALNKEIATMFEVSEGLYLIKLFCITSGATERPTYFAYGITDIV